MDAATDPYDLALDFGDMSPHSEPVLPREATKPFEEAALIGGQKLRSDGFFVNVVKPAAAGATVVAQPTVLVVEDDPGTSAVIVAVLGKEGFRTRTAANLQGILKGVNARPHPDAILLDVMLPDANGFSVLERIRRHPELGGTAVVMLTSLSEPSDVAKGLALGANGYLSKPARPQVLISAIRAVLGTGA
jgi:two-component system OmpR family response regulator